MICVEMDLSGALLDEVILEVLDEEWVQMVDHDYPSKIFTPSRGLRYGDPLSPFLFILMMEGLGRSIKQAKAMGNIKGLQVTENGQTLTHQ